jgi:hypothetical protein
MIALIALGLLAIAAIIATVVVTARDGYHAQPTIPSHAGGSPYPHTTQITRLG